MIKQWLLYGPYSTNDELLALRATGVQEVVSVLDERSHRDAPWISREAEWAQRYGFRVKRFPLRADPVSSAEVQRLVEYLETQPGPVYVHGFLTDKRVRAVYDAARTVQAQSSPAGAPPGNY